MEAKFFDEYGNHPPPKSLKGFGLTLGATGRKIMNRDLEEAVKFPVKVDLLPHGWLDGEMEEDLCPPLPTRTYPTIGISSPPPADGLHYPTTPPSNVWDNALEMEDETLGQSTRERMYSSSSSTTLGSQEALRLWDEVIQENNDSSNESPVHREWNYSSEPKDCLHGDRHEGSNWQQNQLRNNPCFEDDSGSDPLLSAACGPTEFDLNLIGNDSIVDLFYQSVSPPSRCSGNGIVEDVPNELMMPIGGHHHNEIATLPAANTARLPNDVSIELDHENLNLIDLDQKLYEYRGNYGVFPVTSINPQYTYDTWEETYEALEIAKCNAQMMNLEMINVDQEMQLNQYETEFEEMEQESTENGTQPTIGCTREVLSLSLETKKKTVGRPVEYPINPRPDETPQEARERETQERARGKKSDRLKKQREAVKEIHQILQELGDGPPKLMKVLKDHISLQPGSKKGPRPNGKGKFKQHKNEAEKLAARRESGKESAKRFRERENEEIDIFKKTIEIAKKEQMKSTNQRMKEAIDHFLKNVPLYDGSPKKRRN